MTWRVERIERNPGGLPEPIVGVTRNAPVDPDGSRRDHPPGEDRGGADRRRPRPKPAPPADGLPHVDLQA